MLHSFVVILSLWFSTKQWLVNAGVGCAGTDNVVFIANAVYGCDGAWTSGGIPGQTALCNTASGYTLCSLQKTIDLGLDYGECSANPATGTNFYAANVGVASFGDCSTLGNAGVYGCFDTANGAAESVYTSTENGANYTACGALQTQLSHNTNGWRGWDQATDGNELMDVQHDPATDGGGVLCCLSPPTGAPSMAPSSAPTAPSAAPSMAPSSAPTPPSAAPSAAPSPPSAAPSNAPSGAPTPPSAAPTSGPSPAPSVAPSVSPTPPSAAPSDAPSSAPTPPSNAPTTGPSPAPSVAPSGAPTPPSAAPSMAPSSAPTPPSAAPSLAPSAAPVVPATSVTMWPADAPNTVLADLQLLDQSNVPVPLDVCMPENVAASTGQWSRYTCASATASVMKTTYNDASCTTVHAAATGLVSTDSTGSCAEGSYTLAHLQLYVQPDATSMPLTGCNNGDNTTDTLQLSVIAGVCAEISTGQYMKIECSASTGFSTFSIYTSAYCNNTASNSLIMNSTSPWNCTEMAQISSGTYAGNRVYATYIAGASGCTTDTRTYGGSSANVISATLALLISIVSYLLW